MKTIYVSLIRSVIDYGSIAYGLATRPSLERLDVIQGLSSGAFQTSPVAALQVEMGEMPLQIRRQQLAINYWVSLQGHGVSHPAKGILQACWEHERRQNTSFGWVGNTKAKEMGLYGREFSPMVAIPVNPPWLLPPSVVDLDVLETTER